MHAPDMACLFLRFSKSGIQFITFLQGGGFHPSPVALPLNLGKIQVTVFVGGHNQVQSRLFRLFNGLEGLVLPPCVNRFPRMVNAGVPLIPELRRLPVFGKQNCRFRKKGSHLFLFVLHACFSPGFPAQRAFFPDFRGGLVPAQMNDTGREDILEFIKDGGIKFPDFRLLGTDQFLAVSRCRPHVHVRFGEAEKFRVGCRQDLVVPRHVYFRDDLNAERCAVRHQLLQFLFGVHPLVGDSVSEAFRPPGGDAFQFGVTGHGQPPALVVRQMQVQLVEFVVGHEVHEFFQVLDGDEMPRGVHHEAAPGVARLVRNDAAGDALRLLRQLVPKLAEGCQPVNSALLSSGSEVRSLRGDREPVGVRSQGRSFPVGKKL